MSKLYTEKEIKRRLENQLEEEITINEFIESLTPIQLPTDEDIYNESPYNITDTYDLGYHNGWMIGAKWVVNKIKGGGE